MMKVLALVKRSSVVRHRAALCGCSWDGSPAAHSGRWKHSSADNTHADVQNKPLPKFISERLRCFEKLKERYEARLAERVAKETCPIRISLLDGTVVRGHSWRTTPYDVAVQIRLGSIHNIIGARVNGSVYDLSRPLEADSEVEFLTFDTRDGQDIFWHSSAHVLGAALEQFYGGLLCHGPSTENGFFYDIHLSNSNVTDLPGLEAICKDIIKQKLPFQRVEVTREDLLELFKHNKFKVQIIEDKVEATTSVYRCGTLVDLCQGPHVRHTGKIKAFKLSKNSSAFWRADPTQDPLQRVYGISFPDSKQMKEWERLQEEAASRDHRKIGRDQNLFFFHEFSPGSCFFLPKGAHIYNVLIDFIKSEYRKRGFTEVITPNMYKNKLWEQSGHWEHYEKNMFSFTVEDETFSLKPMNCPGHW